MKNFILTTLCCLASLPASAWGPLGHKVVARAAEHRLTPAALAAVQTLLGPGAQLEQISNCADDRLYAPVGAMSCGGLFDIAADPAKTTFQWHWISIPINTDESKLKDLSAFCPGGTDCVVEQVRRWIAVLESATATVIEKQMALLYVVHLVTDQHVPLHGAEGRNADGTFDRGGNDKPATIFGVKKTLHSMWDDLLLPETWQVQENMDPAPLVSELDKDLAKKDVSSWTNSDFIGDASRESFRISRDLIYPQYAKDHGENLGREYVDQMRPILLDRMERGAVRLAAILNRIYDKPEPAQPSHGTLLSPERIKKTAALTYAPTFP